jgi:RES domain-containing protein
MSGTWWRHVPAGADPRHEPADPANSRWQRGSVVGALYLADSEETAWAEWYRYLAEAGASPRVALPRDLWRWEISLSRVADLTTEDRLARVRLSRPRPTRLDWPAFQDVGERLHRDGWAALVSVSAARPAGLALCLFSGTCTPADARPLPPPTRVDDPPLVPPGLRT